MTKDLISEDFKKMRTQEDSEKPEKRGNRRKEKKKEEVRSFNNNQDRKKENRQEREVNRQHKTQGVMVSKEQGTR